MRIFALSDLHIDYTANAKWVADLSAFDYRNDVLILAGDVTDSLGLLEWCLRTLSRCFLQVLFVPGNHELWVVRDLPEKDSLQKFHEVMDVVASSGVAMQTFRAAGVQIVPLLGWYDHSFGKPSEELKSIWMDYHACRWPTEMEAGVADHFIALNDVRDPIGTDKIISFSHFLPRIDVMPAYIPRDGQLLYPILGTTLLEQQLRKIGSSAHVYGHSHVNRSVTIDGVTYINNAFGYPQENRITAKRLLCVYEC